MIPAYEKFHNWLKEQKKTMLPQSAAGKAISYTIGEWDKIIRYLDHHLLTPDNNLPWSFRFASLLGHAT
jgi:transposase